MVDSQRCHVIVLKQETWQWNVIVPSLSHIRLFVTPWTAARQASLSFIISRSLLRLMSIEPVMPSNHLILCHPLLLLPSIFPSIRVFPMSWLFTSGGQSIELQLQHQSFQWILRSISFRIDWFDLLVVRRTLKSLLQHHNLRVLVLWHSTFFMVQLSHFYMTTVKNIALTLLFNMLSRFVIAFFSRSKHLLISWLQSPSAWIWSPRK